MSIYVRRRIDIWVLKILLKTNDTSIYINENYKRPRGRAVRTDMPNSTIVHIERLLYMQHHSKITHLLLSCFKCRNSRYTTKRSTYTMNSITPSLWKTCERIIKLYKQLPGRKVDSLQPPIKQPRAAINILRGVRGGRARARGRLNHTPFVFTYSHAKRYRFHDHTTHNERQTRFGRALAHITDRKRSSSVLCRKTIRIVPVDCTLHFQNQDRQEAIYYIESFNVRRWRPASESLAYSVCICLQHESSI